MPADTRSRRGPGGVGAVVAAVALQAAALQAGCDDPSLTIMLAPPPDLTETVRRTVVTAYQSESLTCDAIAFGQTSEAALDAARIAEIELERTSTLVGLPRVERKLLVARGFVGEGGDIPAASGCAELGEVVGEETVTIQGQLVASVALGGTLGTGGFADRRIGVDVDQPNGSPLSGREVRWATTGPHGSFAGANRRSSADAGVVIATDASGRAVVEPAEADVFGPMVAEVTVAWADRAPPLVQGFMQGEDVRVALPAGGGSGATEVSCVIRQRLAAPTVACLMPGTLGSQRVVELRLNSTALTTRDLSEPGINDAFALVSATGPGGTDKLYAILTDGRWLGLDGTADGVTADLCRRQQGSCTVTPVAATSLPSCSGSTPLVVVELDHSGGRKSFSSFTTDGVAVAGLSTRIVSGVQLVAGGCVGYGESLAEALVMSSGDVLAGVNAVFVDCGGAEACAASWFGAAVATFAQGPGSTDLPRLVGSVADVSGPLIVEWTLAPDVGANGNPTVVLRERRRTPAAASPAALVAGRFDADDIVDLAWSIAIGDVAPGARIQVALAPDVAGQRLTGLARGSRGRPRALISVDLDCDGRDDLLTVSDSEAQVYRTGIPIAGQPPPSGC